MDRFDMNMVRADDLNKLRREIYLYLGAHCDNLTPVKLKQRAAHNQRSSVEAKIFSAISAATRYHLKLLSRTTAKVSG
jgi:hypothetical protein